jgi:hypothetical protein
MHLYDLIKTLTTLNLRHNQIGDVGAQHLVNALEHNTVRLVLYSSVLKISASFNSDTHFVESQKKQDRPRRRKIFG